MKKVISLLLALCLLAAVAAAGAEGRAPEGKPWVNSNLLDYLTPERPAPEDGFDMYANYDAYKNAKSQNLSFTLSSLEEAEIISRGQILDLCRGTEAEYPEDEILRIVYGFIADLEKRNADGLAPLMAKVDRVKAVETMDGLLALLQEEGFLPCDTLFNTGFQLANYEPDLVVLYTSRSPLLEDKPLEQEAEIGKAYEPEKDTETPRAMLMRMQYSEEEAAALLERMKEYDDYFPDEPVEWPERILTIEQLKEKSPFLHAQLAGLGLITEGRAYELDADSIETANHFFTAENLDLLKAIIALKLYRFSVNYLDEETWKTEGFWYDDGGLDRNLYTKLYDTAEIAVDQAYLKHFCPEENREKVVALFADYKGAMRDRITQNAWMDEETKKTALEKLDLIEVAPFTATGGMFDCEPLKTALQSCDTLLDATAACRLFTNRCMLRYAGQPYDRGNRYLPNTGYIMNSNGMYDPKINMISIGAPALNMPMFNTKSRATLLGSIGHHLGHELSHAFSIGCLTDATGQGPLYTEETGKLFMERVNAMIAKMDQIELLDGVMLKGNITISELMSDVTGVCLSLDLAKKEEDFDYAEFFLTYASFFRSSSPNREATLKVVTGNGVHPYPYVRVNYTVAQFDEFYEAFPSVTEGTPMYIAPEDRILIW